MATIKIGINGFGRIGRMVFRAAVQNFADIEVVAINDLLEPEYLAYMLQYDSVHGRFKSTIAVDGNTPIVGGKRIRLTQEKDPANLKWGEVGAGIVIESTGLFLTKDTGKNVSEPRTAMPTTKIVPIATPVNASKPVRNSPASEIITVRPETAMARPDVRAAVCSAARVVCPLDRSSRTRRR